MPGVAQPAMQAGRYVAKVLEARVSGWPPPKPFKYFDKGNLAVIGRRRAVADAFGIQYGGMLAWVTWGFVHVMYLVGWGNRLGAVARWTWFLVTRQRRERAIPT
jgi:NADH dehydrogenase